MISWIQTQAWKLAAVGLGILAATLMVALVRMTMDRNRVEKQRAALELSIEKSSTGWRDRLVQCQHNTDDLVTSISDQNAKIRAIGAESAAKIAAAQKAVNAAGQGKAAADAKVKSLLRPLSGADQCAKVNEADARFLETLK